MGYTTIDAMRAEGVTEAMADDTRLTALIALETARIDRLTRQFFEPRELTLKLSGEGTPRLQFDVPIIEIASITIADAQQESLVAADEYVVFNRHLTQGLVSPDDRNDPRVEYVRETGNVFATETALSPFFSGGRVWQKGRQNIVVVGTFGYTDPDPDQDPDDPIVGVTPVLIEHACKLLIIKQLPKMVDADARRAAFVMNRIQEERTRDQSYRVGGMAGEGVRLGGATGYLTGDEEIDSILEHYMRPLAIGHT